ncbi:MAG: hypothetical protein A3F78_09405 [Burkholderiales bacterium RIFCSPLOWO2_12_FULL_61_40]|nr:MAG: hypothetical protein A3F78_09405 [Burkholderiales bacterium RIFCSPLOWO2_12_FULL_61_40]
MQAQRCMGGLCGGYSRSQIPCKTGIAVAVCQWDELKLLDTLSRKYEFALFLDTGMPRKLGPLWCRNQGDITVINPYDAEMGNADSAARFRMMAQTAVDAIVSANPDGIIVFWNDAAEKMFGYSAGAAIGQPLTLLMPERYRLPHRQGFVRYMQTGVAHLIGGTVEVHGLTREGHEFPIELSLSVWNGIHGPCFTAIIRDISARKKIELALQQKTVELEKANSAKDSFLASMSHELRTPLNAIIGFTGTLLMQLHGPLTPEQVTKLSTIQSSAKHLRSLINDILNVAEIDSGTMELHPEPIFCSDILEEVAARLRPAALNKGLLFEVAPMPQDIQIHTDRRILSQILSHLVNNAIKYTEQGRVEICCNRRKEHEHHYVDISISDTGIGIRPEDQRRLFQAFTQVDTSSTRRHGGAGLGLHLSRKLAALIGGVISFHSEFGRGSTFTLTLEGQVP